MENALNHDYKNFHIYARNEEHADRCTFHEMFTCVVAGYFELSWVCDCHKEMICYVFLLFFRSHMLNFLFMQVSDEKSLKKAEVKNL